VRSHSPVLWATAVTVPATGSADTVQTDGSEDYHWAMERRERYSEGTSIIFEPPGASSK